MAKAGSDGFFDDAGLPLAEGWDQTDLPTRKDSLISLTIDGDSMTPLYRPGDRVAVRTADGETLAKEIAIMNARDVTLTSINPAYPPRTLPRRDILWMARILWVSQ